MIKAMKRNKVYGFLDVQDGKLVNGRGEPILLTGWGLGNWLLPEGYMWLAGGPRMDRPRTIERIVAEVAGEDYAAHFWQEFRSRYVRKEDIARMAELGYNSVRIPINARLFLEEKSGLHWVDEGFELLDHCLAWCETYGLYAFIDLHGAPGGQTGSNIDDSTDDFPRLFTDEDCFRKGIALWKKLAERYADRWVVGGYDLLNEPLRPAMREGQEDTAYLLPELRRFYREAIREIRKVDQKHLFSIEGHHWSSSPEIFDEKFDEKMLIHFHRYACLPDIDCYKPFLKAAKELNMPLWLGETGENVSEWFTAMYPLAAELGIGYNIWPWKKMRTQNSPCSIRKPEGWDAILDYSRGGKLPDRTEAQKALDEYLDNMLLENCDENVQLHDAIFRRPGAVMRATDFDELGGAGVSYLCRRKVENPFSYRTDSGMEIVEADPNAQKEFGFDCLWRRFTLGLEAGEFACYTLFDIPAGAAIAVTLTCRRTARLRIEQDETELGEWGLSGENVSVTLPNVPLRVSDRSVLSIRVDSGRVELEKITTFR